MVGGFSARVVIESRDPRSAHALSFEAMSTWPWRFARSSARSSLRFLTLASAPERINSIAAASQPKAAARCKERSPIESARCDRAPYFAKSSTRLKTWVSPASSNVRHAVPCVRSGWRNRGRRRHPKATSKSLSLFEHVRD